MKRAMTDRDVATVALTSPGEIVPLTEWENHKDNPMTQGATRHAVRQDGPSPEFRAALFEVNGRHYVHIPSWLAVFERYRLGREG